MLEAKNITFCYPDVQAPVLEDVSVRVRTGELVALVGPNGSGKTTLARILCGAIKPSSGSVLLDGSSEACGWPLVGYVRQDPFCQLVSELVYDEVAFGLRSLNIPEEEFAARVERALKAVGLTHVRMAQTSELSVGEQQRLALAGVLVAEPKYIVLDEPTAFLDVVARTRFIALLQELVASGTGIILVTHRKEEIALADKVCCVGNGAQNEGSQSGESSQRPSFDLLGKTSGAALCLNDVTIVRGEVTALQSVSLRALPGRITLLAGCSGSGKSTTAQLLAGTLEPTSGQATYGDKPIAVGSVGLCMQRAQDQLFCNTILEDVAFGPLNDGLGEVEATGRAQEALALMDVPEQLWQRHSMSLSGGERRRVAIACLLAMDYGAYIFDEPMASLDERGQEKIAALVRMLADAGKTVLVISHDVGESLSWADDAIVLQVGRVVYEGPAEDFPTYEYGLPFVEPSQRELRAGWLRSVPAGAQVLLLIMVTALVFLTSSPLLVGLYAVVALALLLASGAKWREAFQNLRGMVVVLLFAFAANAFILDGTGDVPLVGPLSLSTHGVALGVRAVLRIVALVLWVGVVARSTTTEEVAHALLTPLRLLGGKKSALVRNLTTITMLSLRTLPFCIEEFGRIEQAQRIRKAPLGKGSLQNRISSWISVIVPMVVAVMQHGDDVAEALNDRGYGG